MESTINRKDYRRNSLDNYERRERVQVEVSNASNNSLFLNKVINSMLLLLSILLLKFFNFNAEFNFIKDKFNSGIGYDVIEEMVRKKLNEFNENSINVNIGLESGDNEFQNDTDVLSGDESIVSGEKEYITAVEGVNKLMEDSENVKKNYEIKNPLNGVITSAFGLRVSDNPIVSSYHTGLDIAANVGTNIISAHSGKVIQAGDNGTYGKSVMIENGDLITLYAHCSEVLVKNGEEVSIGQNIAKVGMTGNATGPHLHFEIRYQGRVVNPEDVI